MIFVTIGTQEPFDRLIKTMDELAHKLHVEIVAQVSEKSDILVKNMKTFDFMEPKEFDQYFNNAELIVAHAGMGTIISSLVKRKPLIILPREREFMEHRNDHQLATVKYFSKLGLINAAKDINDLELQITEFMKGTKKLTMPTLGNFASTSLIEAIRDEIGF